MELKVRSRKNERCDFCSNNLEKPPIAVKIVEEDKRSKVHKIEGEPYKNILKGCERIRNGFEKFSRVKYPYANSKFEFEISRSNRNDQNYLFINGPNPNGLRERLK